MLYTALSTSVGQNQQGTLYSIQYKFWQKFGIGDEEFDLAGIANEIEDHVFLQFADERSNDYRERISFLKYAL